jgi:hypothetical protein
MAGCNAMFSTGKSSWSALITFPSQWVDSLGISNLNAQLETLSLGLFVYLYPLKSGSQG